MTDSSKETFNVPPGFSIEEINGQLYHEDLEEDDELWLMRIPCDIELSELDRQKIFLASDAEGTNSKNLETESGKLLQCYAETRDISNTCVVLPKRQDGQLHAVKKVLKGSILIAENLPSNIELEIKTEKEDDSFDPNSCSIVQSNGEKAIKETKKSYSDNLEKNYESMAGNGNNSTSKKRKSSKEKRNLQENFDSSDLNYETEAAESTYSSKSQKKQRSYSDNLKKNYESMPKNADSSTSKKSSKKKRNLQEDFDSSHLNYETEAAESTYSSKSQKKQRSYSDNLKKNYETMPGNANNSTSKKSSKKKRNLQEDFDSSDLNYETEAAESTYSPKPQKLSRHDTGSSRKSSERKTIKKEPLSVDFGDEFPSCSSQK